MEKNALPGPGSVVGGRYRLVRQLGSGGMGAVWLAHHVQLGAEVALKFMSPEVSGSGSARARFEREAKVAAQLSHPNIVRVQDYGIEGELPYLVMERLIGEDLGEKLKRVGKLASTEIAALAVQIGRGLRRMHDAGLVHRDLKPANVFLVTGEDGEVLAKLLDLGIVKKVSVADGESTRTGEIMGSPHYMSPEQIQNAKSISIQSDLWSFGVLLFRAMTGQQPFKAEGVGAIIAAILTSPIPTPSALAPDLAPEIDRFFERALARDPAGRFQSAREMVDALLEALGVRPPASSLPHPGVSSPTSFTSLATPLLLTPEPPPSASASAAAVPDTLVSLSDRTGARMAPRRRAVLIGSSLGGVGGALLMAWVLWAPETPGVSQSSSGQVIQAPALTMFPDRNATEAAPGGSADAALAASTDIAPAGSAEVAPAGSAEVAPAGSADAIEPAGSAPAGGSPAPSAPQRGSAPWGQDADEKDEPEGPLRPPRTKRSLGF